VAIRAMNGTTVGISRPSQRDRPQPVDFGRFYYDPAFNLLAYRAVTAAIFQRCQGRSNRSSIVHEVSYFVIDTACIFNFFAYHRCFAYDFHFSKAFENFSVYAVSMTPNAF
jgi:hypothetical protein